MTQSLTTPVVPLAPLFTGRNEKGQYMKGFIPWDQGKHHALESRRKMSIAKKGKPLSEEWRRHLGESQKGRRHSKETREKISYGNRRNNWLRISLWRLFKTGKRRCTEETKRKISTSHKGKKWTKEQKKQCSLRYTGSGNPHFGKHHSPEVRLKISLATKGKSRNKGTKRPWLAEYNKTHVRRGKEHPNYGKHFGAGIPKSVEWRRKISATRILRGLSKGEKNPMKKEENIRKWLKSSGVKPNKPEQLLYKILQEVAPNQYRFNDGWFILGGKVPDFPNVNGAKKLVEMFGDFFHRGQNPNDRIDYFAKYGWQTLIVWENELRQPEALREKLLNFAGRSG